MDPIIAAIACGVFRGSPGCSPIMIACAIETESHDLGYPPALGCPPPRKESGTAVCWV